ncbi:MAG TPA: hypothetical protein VE422_33020 [Terriglobia bacterium]|nr:hypothetical protein [Terriglobia bacterium]
MRRYEPADEERIRSQALVREWTRSGLLNPVQTGPLEEDLRVNLRRTNLFLRLVLFAFTLLIVAASLLLLIDNIDARGAISAIAALVCFVLAEYLISRFRLYRFGVEEGFAAAAVVLAGIASTLHESYSRFSDLVALVVAALCAFGVYRRFGYVYAALASFACAALVPFQTSLSPEMQRAAAAGILVLIFATARAKHLLHGDEFPGDEYGMIQAAAWAGLYFNLNLPLSFSRLETSWFYWSTYVLIWILPVIGLRMALRDRDRLLLDVNLAMALATIATNKSYLDLPRRPWDPILFGVFLMAAALSLRRWLSKGPDGQRSGFTPLRLVSSDRRALALMSAASAVVQPDIPAAAAGPTKPELGGGRSGGGGASGSF